jgi:hypothetical protein
MLEQKRNFIDIVVVKGSSRWGKVEERREPLGRRREW